MNDSPDEIEKLITLLEDFREQEKRELYNIINEKNNPEKNKTSEYMYWLSIRRGFFLQYLNQAYRRLKHTVKRQSLEKFEEWTLLGWFFEVNKTLLELLEIKAFQSIREKQHVLNIIEQTCSIVAGILRRAENKDHFPMVVPRFIDHTLTPLQPWEIHTFPARWMAQSPINLHYSRPIWSPNNHHIKDSLIPYETLTLKENIARMRARNDHPLCFLHLENCATNVALRQQIEGLIGEDLIHEVSVGPWDNLEEVLLNIKHWSQGGGIIIVWWSHEDAFSPYGREFSNFMKKIVGMVENDRWLGLFATCFGYQVLAQSLGIGETHPGMLEMGSYWVRNTSSEILEWFWEEFSVSLAHTGHVILDRSNVQKRDYSVLGENLLTGQPVWVISWNRKVIGVQLHTELHQANIRGFIDSFPGDSWSEIRRKYGIGQTRIENNFRTGKDEAGEIIAPRDIWWMLIRRFLRTISDQIVPR